MSSADIPTPARPTGSLTCIVEIELSPKMDIAMTVTTVVTGPAGYITNTSQPVMGGTTTYTSTFIISSLGRNVQSRNYTCVATLCSTQTNAYIICSSPTVQFVATGEGHCTIRSLA